MGPISRQLAAKLRPREDVWSNYRDFHPLPSLPRTAATAVVWTSPNSDMKVVFS